MPVLESPKQTTVKTIVAKTGTKSVREASLTRRFFQYLRRAYSLDLRSLALFRVGLALVLLGDLLARSFDLTAFYSDWGVLPRAALLDRFAPADRFSIHLMSGQPTFQRMLFVLAAFFAVMLLLGVKTRLATIASWFMLVSLQNRNLVTLQGGDVYLRLLALWAIFLPLGAVYSVDSALNTAPSDSANEKHKYSFFSVPGVALMLQVAFVYGFAVLLKTGPEWRQDHSAVYYALNIQQMSTSVGRFLLHFPNLLPWLTRSALAYEGTVPFLIFMPFLFGPVRTFGVLAILVLHLGFGLSIRLGHFPWVAAVAALPLLPGWFWDTAIPRSWRARFRHAGEGVRIYYDELCPFCKKSTFILRTFCMLPAAEVLPMRDLPMGSETEKNQHAWIVVDRGGARRSAFDALACMLACSPLFGWMSSICHRKMIEQIGNACCNWIRNRRDQLSDLTIWLKFRCREPRTPWVVSVLVFILITYVFFWNLSDVTHRAFPPSQEKLGITLDLDQKWDMFAPSPLTYDGWYVISGRLRNGAEVNVLHPDQPVSFAQPESIADQYPNERWRKYLMNLSLSEYTDYRLYYGRYFCRSWNTGRRQNDPNALVAFDIFFMGRQNSIDRPPTGFSRELLWHHECFK